MYISKILQVSLTNPNQTDTKPYQALLKYITAKKHRAQTHLMQMNLIQNNLLRMSPASPQLISNGLFQHSHL